MRIIKGVYRLIRLLFLAYGLWNGLLRSRWVTIGIALWKILGRRRVRPVQPTAAWRFVNGSEPAIYRRRGIRRIVPRRTRSIR